MSTPEPETGRVRASLGCEKTPSRSDDFSFLAAAPAEGSSIQFDSPTKQPREEAAADLNTPESLRGIASAGSPLRLTLSQQCLGSQNSLLGLDLQLSQPNLPPQAPDAHGGGIVFGTAGDEQAFNLDPMFGAYTGPPLPPIQVPVRVKAVTHVRICCYGFEVRKDHPTGGFTLDGVRDFIREKVEITQELFAGNPSSSVLLVDTPAHFFTDEEDHGLLWLVFKTKGTYINRWESLRRSLQCRHMRLISAHPMVKNGTRGLAHVVAHFGLNEEKSTNLYRSLSLDIGFVKSETRQRRSPQGSYGGAVKDEGEASCEWGQDHDTPHHRAAGKKRKASPTSDAGQSSQPHESGGGIQSRYKMKRSLKPCGEASDKTPMIARAVPGGDTGNRDDDERLPVVRSLAGSFKDGQPGPVSSYSGGAKDLVSPRRSKKDSRRLDDGSSPTRDKSSSSSSSKARAGGPSPNRDKGKGRASHPPTPSIVPSTIEDSCYRYISEEGSVDATPTFVEEFYQFVKRTMNSTSSGNALEVIENSSHKALDEFLNLQSLVVKAVRERYCIPIENLTPTGIVPNHHNWAFLKENNHDGYRYLSGTLESLVAAVSQAFDKGFFLIDPVSISFFLAIQALNFRHDKQSRHNLFLEFACQGLAHDLKRLYSVNHSLILLLKALSVDDEPLVARYADASVDDFITSKLSVRLQAILAEPHVAEEAPSKARRLQKFENTIKEVCMRYKVPYSPSGDIGKAHSIFKTMQQASSFFRALDVSHENYALFTSMQHDMRAMETLYKNVYECSLVLPSVAGLSSSAKR